MALSCKAEVLSKTCPWLIGVCTPASTAMTVPAQEFAESPTWPATTNTLSPKALFRHHDKVQVLPVLAVVLSVDAILHIESCWIKEHNRGIGGAVCCANRSCRPSDANGLPGSRESKVALTWDPALQRLGTEGTVRRSFGESGSEASAKKCSLSHSPPCLSDSPARGLGTSRQAKSGATTIKYLSPLLFGLFRPKAIV